MEVPDRPVFGHCVVSSTYKFISIPKCASTYGLNLLSQELDWKISNFLLFDHSQKKSLIILRHPIERWKSAMFMYFLYPHLNIHINLSDPKTIFDKLCFEPHTDLQTNFLKNIDLNQAIFFKFDNNLEYNLTTFLEKKCNCTNIKLQGRHLDKQKNETNVVRKKLNEIIDFFLQDKLNEKKLMNYLKPDFDLYNNISYTRFD